MNTAAAPSSRRHGAVALALLAPALIATAFSWPRQCAEQRDIPDDADYAFLPEALRQQGFESDEKHDWKYRQHEKDAQHDALTILPPWSLRPYALLGDWHPISGDRLAVNTSDGGGTLLQRYQRLFVIVEPDADAYLADVAKNLGNPQKQVCSENQKVCLSTYALPYKTTYDFREHLTAEKTQIFIQPVNATWEIPTPTADSTADMAGVMANHPDWTPCHESVVEGGTQSGWQCQSRPNWQQVKRQWLHVTENGAEAMWAHPPPRGERLAVRYPDAVLGTHLAVTAAFTRDGQERARAPVRLRVWIDGREVLQQKIPQKMYFHTFDVDTSNITSAKTADGNTAQTHVVDFIIDTEDNGSCHFAFDAVAYSQ